MNFRTLVAWGLILGNGEFLAAKSQQAVRVPPARVATAEAKRLPPALVRARTVFLINEAPGAATDAEFRELRAQLRNWNHFEVVDRADRSDVTMSLGVREVERAGLQNGAPVGAKFVNPSKAIVRINVSTLTVRQRSTGEILWSGETGTVTTALQRLQQEMPGGPRMCVVFWCW
jgi:hypothetical protein